MKTNKLLNKEMFQRLLEEMEQKGTVSNSTSLVNSVDEFEKEALEGFRDIDPKGNSISQLDKKWAQQYLPKSTFTQWILAGTGIAGLIVGTYFITKQSENTVIKNPDLVRIEKTDVQLPEYIEEMQVLANEKQISIKEIKKAQQTIKTVPSSLPEVTENEREEFIATILEPLPIEIKQKQGVESIQKKAKEIYLNNFKAIDYREYRSKPSIAVEQFVMSGTPANLENELDAEEYQNTKVESSTHDVPYIDYLQKSLKLLDRAKWKEALVRFEEILTTYPDDVNARFYAGLCLYNLKQFSPAEINFSTCIQLEYDNFNQEAMWYLALAKLGKGEKSEATNLLKEIISQNGYYKKMAESKLSLIKN